MTGRLGRVKAQYHIDLELPRVAREVRKLARFHEYDVQSNVITSEVLAPHLPETSMNERDHEATRWVASCF